MAAALRAVEDLGLKEAAEKLEVSVETIRRWRKGEWRRLSPEVRRHLDTRLGQLGVEIAEAVAVGGGYVSESFASYGTQDQPQGSDRLWQALERISQEHADPRERMLAREGLAAVLRAEASIEAEQYRMVEARAAERRAEAAIEEARTRGVAERRAPFTEYLPAASPEAQGEDAAAQVHRPLKAEEEVGPADKSDRGHGGRKRGKRRESA